MIVLTVCFMRRWAKLIWHFKTPSMVTQSVNNLPAVWETQVWSLSWEDPLEKEMATHSSILAWKISWTAEPGRLQSMWSPRVRANWATKTLSLFTWNTFQEECWLLQSLAVLRREFFWIKTVTWGKIYFLFIFQE